MNLQLTSKTAFALALFFCLSFAQETDISSRQQAVLSALDSIEENVMGFALNGRAKGGLLYSDLSSKALPNEESVSEYSAFTNFLLGISIRPSNETKATFDLQFHKDWQSAYREGNNSPIIRWWSYDGNILDKKLKFNLGTMRLAYTPLTLYLPEPDLIMEPEVFSELKKEAMEERYLDGTKRRLLQGLNLEFATSAGIFDKIFLQGTLVRLRRVPDWIDRVFFDFDPNKDRFSAGARISAEAFGFSLGLNDVYTFNRYGSSIKDTLLDYEKNNVLSFELGYNSKKSFSGPLTFGIGAEYALSNWKHDQERRIGVDSVSFLYFATDISLIPAIGAPSVYPYYQMAPSNRYKYERSGASLLENKGAMLANAFAAYEQEPFAAKLSAHFLNVDKDFESELAASPAYLPNLPILNSDAALGYNLEQFRAGSLENMYYSLYNTLPLNAITIVSTYRGNVSYVICANKSSPTNVSQSFYQAACLDNNYDLAHYYRNAYTQQTYTRLERGSDARFAFLDPSVNMALPYGFATPDRKGGGADLSFAFNKAVQVKGVFGSYSSEYGDYTRFGGGLEVNVANLANLSKALVLSASYEQNKEENGFYNPQTDRIMAGAKIGIWRGLSLLGGFQQLSKEFKNPYYIINDPDAGSFAIEKTSETLVIGGSQIKISERANFSLQGALLTNTISFIIDGAKEELDLDKFIMSGTVTVEF